MSFKIADAFVDVEYRTEAAQRQLEQGLAGKKVKVDVDTKAAEASLTRLTAARDAKVKADITQAELALKRLEGVAEKATGDKKIKADADVASAMAKLELLRAQLEKVDTVKAKVSEPKKIDFDIGAAMSKIGSLSLGLLKVQGLVSAVGAASSLAVASIAPMIGIGAIASAGMGSVAAGISGVGAALKAMEANEKAAAQGGAAAATAQRNLAEAMAGLTPQGRAFAVFLQGFIDGPLKQLKDSAQVNLLPGLQAGLEKIVPMMGPITAAFGQFSKTLGQALGGLVPVIGALAGPFLTFADAALKGLQPLQGVLQTFATQLGAVFTQLARSGQAQAAMGALVDVLGALLPVIPPLIQLATQLFTLLGPPLAQLIRTLLPLIMQMAEAFGPVLSEVIKALLPVITQVAQALGPVFVTILETLLTALRPLFPVLGPLAQVFGQLLVAIVPILIPIGQLIAALVQGLLPIVQALLPVINLFTQLLTALMPILIPLINVLAQVIAILVQLDVMMVTSVVPAIRNVGQGFTDLWQKSIVPAWNGIQSVISTVWNWIKSNVFDRITAGLSVLGAGFTALWRTYVDPAWTGIKAVVQVAYTTIAGLFDLLVAALKVLGGWFTSLWKTYVTPALDGIKASASAAWAYVKSNFIDPATVGLQALGAVFTGLWKNYVVPAWNGIQSALSTGWNAVKANVFDKFTAVVNGLGAVFDAAQKAIGVAWGRVQDAAKAPVVFVVNYVMAPLANAWNAIMSKIDSSHTLPVPHMASGGPIVGPGTGTSDDVPLLGSAGEWIIRQRAAQQIGPTGMAMINNADRLGLQVHGDIGTLGIRRYADGGLVTATQGWLQGLTSVPYVWGGVGPSGYDCSGLVGEVWARLTGHPSYHRYMTTLSNFSSLGFAPGTGTFTIGVNSEHMVGNLGGLGFEAPHTGANVRIGSAAQSPGNVGALWYLKDYGAGGGGGGGWFDPIEWGKSAIKAVVDKLTGGWWSKLSDMGFFGSAMVGLGKNLLSTIFDGGGMLQPGTSLVTNLSNRPEPVLSHEQWAAVQAALPTQRGSGGATYQFETGSIVLDASRLSSIADLVRLVDNLTTTARAYGGARL